MPPPQPQTADQHLPGAPHTHAGCQLASWHGKAPQAGPAHEATSPQQLPQDLFSGGRGSWNRLHLLLGTAALGASAGDGLAGGAGPGTLLSPSASLLLLVLDPSAAWLTTSRRAPCCALSRTKASSCR